VPKYTEIRQLNRKVLLPKLLLSSAGIKDKWKIGRPQYGFIRYYQFSSGERVRDYD